MQRAAPSGEVTQGPSSSSGSSCHSSCSILTTLLSFLSSTMGQHHLLIQTRWLGGPPAPTTTISFKGKVRSWTHNFFLHSPWPGPSQWAASNRKENKSATFILGGHGSELGAVLEDGEDGRWSLPHLFPSLPVFPHLSHRVASPRVQLSPVLLTTSHCCVN